MYYRKQKIIQFLTSLASGIAGSAVAIMAYTILSAG